MNLLTALCIRDKIHFVNFDKPVAEHELQILSEIERDPNVTQADLAMRMGVAVGKINWYVKRLVNKGYVKVTHLQRRKLHYFLTPAGLARKLALTQGYMEVSLRVYRDLRHAAQDILKLVRQAGYASVCIEGNDEATEILRLTCLEQHISIEKKSKKLPTLRVQGTGFAATWPENDKP